jgi:hypothetical protein
VVRKSLFGTATCLWRKLVPFSSGGASEEELLLVAAGKMRLPEVPLDVDELLKIKTGSVGGSVGGSDAVAALLEDRNEGL